MNSLDRPMSLLTLKVWLHSNPDSWGVWIGEHYIVAHYDGMFAIMDRWSGAHVWHGTHGELPRLPLNGPYASLPPLQEFNMGEVYEAF